ncbi:MAG: SIS domain-containing protein [Acidobacteria bacterium]|nr:SIS domain-containing protein [Acidobacteriota bacterium]
MKSVKEQIVRALEERRNVWSRAGAGADTVATLAKACVTSLRAGGKIFFFGNGGSAAQAEHLAAELVGRYLRDDRPPLAALALGGGGALASALGNDYGFEVIFSRQVEALANKGDVLVGLSTSGRSRNVLEALATGHQHGCITAMFTGDHDLGEMEGVHHLLRVPSRETPAIQELHLFFGHLLCEAIENEFLGSRERAW